MNWEDELKERQFLAYLDRLKSDVYQVIEIKDVIPFIKSLLKKQREICAKIYQNYDSIGEKPPIYDQILNAPEPEGSQNEK